MGRRWIIETAVSIFLFFSLSQITDLHARHKRTLFCWELPLVPLSCPHFFYFWKLILFSDNLYSIILTNILDIFGHACWKVMIDYENQSQIESIISNNLTFICWCLISPLNMFMNNMQEYVLALFVNWGYRLYQLYLTCVVALQPANVCPGYVNVGKNHDLPDLHVAAFRMFQSLKRKTKKSQNGDAQSLLYLFSLA